MTTDTLSAEALHVANAPAVPGLLFRRFRGESDYPAMAAIFNAYATANGDEWLQTAEDIAHDFSHLSHVNLNQDLLMAEVDGALVAYWLGESWAETDGPRLYGIDHLLHPDWRGRGIGQPALDHMERHMRAMAAGHESERPKFFQAFATEGNTYLTALLLANGYAPERRFHFMTRSLLDELPDFPLPEGLEVRPVTPEQYRAIWDADAEAFRDHWGAAPRTEDDYQYWLGNKTTFQPELWQVAWDVASGEVAGQVKTFINHQQNEQFGRLRGYTEYISVRRPWRRRGLARALIARSLRAQRDAGMAESALTVDTDSPTGATRVYADCGFRVFKRTTVYRKPL